jgi:hypothetical protein
MNGPTDKSYTVAWFIKQNLENAFRETGIDALLRNAENEKVNFTFENGNISTDTPGKTVKLDKQQTARLSQAMLNLALKLPAFLYNSGYTSAIISPNTIHIKLHNNFLGVTIKSVGLFILDIKGNKFHARTWKEAPVNEGAPIELGELMVKGSTHKRNLNVASNVSEKIDRDVDFLKGKLEAYLNKQGIPTKLEQLIPEMKVNWLKHKNLVKSASGVHEVYKGLYKMPVHELYDDNALTAVYNIGTAKQGKGNFPGIDAVPGASQVLAVENDMFEQRDLEAIEWAQRFPSTQHGGYQSLIKMMEAYNNNDWGKEKFVGAYVHEGQLEMIEAMESLLTDEMGFSTQFQERPYDHKVSKPYKYFIYVRSDKLSYSLISIKDVGVIYVNPAVD